MTFSYFFRSSSRAAQQMKVNMDSNEFVVVFLLACSFLLVPKEVEGTAWNLSAEDHLALESQLKVLNKPAIKTITTDYGEIYDCVDFYKQPAFDHPLLKNYTINFQLKPSLPHNESRNHSSVRLRHKQCPFGTVPIRRITKEDLIRERLADKVRSLTDDYVPGAHYAVRRTKYDGWKYDGAGAEGNIVYTPECSGQQYSAGRVKISNGAESLETGWRVDPTLYGDTRPHFFIRINAGQTHCFDTRCPGFIVVDQRIAIGGAIDSSKRGGPTLELKDYLVRNIDTGDWNVEIEEGRTLLGYWPKILFTGLSEGATILEWGGEVYSPPGTPKPPMGAGYIPDGTSYDYDAFFRDPDQINGKVTRHILDLVTFEDSKDYQVREREDDFTQAVFYCVFYGGSGGSTTTQ